MKVHRTTDEMALLIEEHKKEIWEYKQKESEWVKTKNLAAYKHNGFWFCMYTLRDKKVLDTMIKTKKSPWLK